MVAVRASPSVSARDEELHLTKHPLNCSPWHLHAPETHLALGDDRAAAQGSPDLGAEVRQVGVDECLPEHRLIASVDGHGPVEPVELNASEQPSHLPEIDFRRAVIE